MRIDRIMVDQHFRIDDFRVINSYISDHFAVMADLELLPTSSASDAQPAGTPPSTP
jgi:hypothetical protein